MRAFIAKHRYYFLLIIGFAVLSHLLLLTNDLPYWDGWTYYDRIGRGDNEGVLKEWRNNGRTIIGLIFLWIGTHGGALISYRVLDITAIALAGCLFYSLLIRETALGCFYSLIATLLGVSYRAYQVHLASTTFTYITALPFFLGGILALFEANTKPRAGLRLVAFALIFVSYISEAYVFAGIALPLLLLARNHASLNVGNVVRYYLRYIDIPLAAVGYMATVWFLMPVQGEYSHARDLSFSVSTVFRNYMTYFASALDFNLLNPTPFIFHHDINLVLWGVLGVLAATVLRRRFRDGQARRALGYALVAFMAIAAVGTPYVLAQRHASTYGWDMRHLTGVGFFAGGFIVCILHYFIANESWRRRVALALVVLSFCSLTKDYLLWEARAALDHGVMENMHDHPEMEQVSTFVTERNRFFFKEIYRFNEWELMMQRVFGHHARFIVVRSFEGGNDAQASGSHEDVPQGKETNCMRFELTPSKESLRVSSGAKYLWLQLTASEQTLAQWEKDRVTLTLTPIPDCKVPLL